MNRKGLSLFVILALALGGVRNIPLFGDDDSGTPGQETHRMAGIGVIVVNDAGDSPRIRDHMVIRQIVDKSPAMKQGLRAGDEIEAIDDTKLAGKNFLNAVNTRLRGELDSVVTLTIHRPGQAKLMTVPFVRKIIPVKETERA